VPGILGAVVGLSFVSAAGSAGSAATWGATGLFAVGLRGTGAPVTLGAVVGLRGTDTPVILDAEVGLCGTATLFFPGQGVSGAGCFPFPFSLP
jgi:hypothetical protein